MLARAHELLAIVATIAAVAITVVNAYSVCRSTTKWGKKSSLTMAKFLHPTSNDHLLPEENSHSGLLMGCGHQV